MSLLLGSSKCGRGAVHPHGYGSVEHKNQSCFMAVICVVDNMDLLLQKIMEQAQEVAKAERWLGIVAARDHSNVFVLHAGVPCSLWTMMHRSWWPRFLTLLCLTAISQV